MLPMRKVRIDPENASSGRINFIRVALLTGSIGAMSLLAGCGGGGDGLATMPPPSGYTRLADATASTSLVAVAATDEYIRLKGVSHPTTRSQANNVEISYDPSTRTYTLRGTPVIGSTTWVTQSFGPSDAVSGSPGNYEKITTTADRTEVRRLNIGTSPLTYSNFGNWTAGETNDGNQTFDTAYFTYGIATKASDMPKTGSASYALRISGVTAGNPVSGSGSLTANFAASTVDVSLALQATESSRPGPPYALGTVTGSGTISTAGSNPGFSSDLAGDRYTGSINGVFYGPQAAEVGGAFAITRDGIGGGPVAGAVLGRKN